MPLCLILPPSIPSAAKPASRMARMPAEESSRPITRFLFSEGISSPILAVSEAVLDFGAGSSELDFVISNTGVDTLNWNLSKTADWLNIDPASGSLTTEERTISVTVDRTGLDSGTYQDQISIDSNGGSRLVSVSMVVGNPVLSVDMTSLDFGSVANSLNFQIENIGAGSLDWEISESVEHEYETFTLGQLSILDWRMLFWSETIFTSCA